MPSKRRPGALADLEEVRPNRFVVHNPLVGSTLRGEGEREGDRFTLTTWRREGLLARLRARQFKLLTLADQVAALPELPPAVPFGPPVVRPLAAGERISIFAGARGWEPAPAAAPESATATVHEVERAAAAAVELRPGQVIRRRKGRGPGDFYLVAPGTLRPLGEDGAIRQGYAQLAQLGAAPVALAAGPDGRLVLVDLPLPPEHHALLGRLADRAPDGWVVADGAAELVIALLARLGLAARHEG